MAGIKTGGPAFSAYDFTESGMQLRDYFAAHAPEPSTSELAKTAGLTVQHGHVSDDDTFLGELHLWREKLSVTEQLALVAKYKWACADAMLKAREVSE